MILLGHIMDHPNLFKRFDHILAAPECRTWSRAASGIYRNKEFIDGHIHIGRLVLPPDSSAVKLLHYKLGSFIPPEFNTTLLFTVVESTSTLLLF